MSLQEPSDLPAELDEEIGEFLELHDDSHSVEDVDDFVYWLSSRTCLKPEEVELLAWMETRTSVEHLAIQQRLEQIRFQSLTARNDHLKRQLANDPTICVHLNPVHVWAKLETRMVMDPGQRMPSQVLVYVDGNQVQTAIIDRDVERLIRELSRGSLRVATLERSLSGEDRDDLHDMIRSLVALRILALS